MRAFILAGGFATRLWPLTEKRAKPLLPLAGVPLVEHLVRSIPEDIPITISTNATFKEAFEGWATKYGRENIDILIEQTTSDDQKLGALGAVAQWIQNKHIDDDIFLLTGDNYCGFSFERFLEAASPDTTLIAAYDIGDIEKASQFGTVVLEKDMRHETREMSTQVSSLKSQVSRVTSFEEKPKHPKTTLVNTGCSVLPKSVLPILVDHAKDHPDNVGGVFERLLIEQKPIECFIFDDLWFDIGSFDAYLEATKALVGEDIFSEPNCDITETRCEGSVICGSGCTVHQSELKNVVLFEHCTVEDCILENCVIDAGCRLSGVDITGKMLREGTHLHQK